MLLVPFRGQLLSQRGGASAAMAVEVQTGRIANTKETTRQSHFRLSTPHGQARGVIHAIMHAANTWTPLTTHGWPVATCSLMTDCNCVENQPEYDIPLPTGVVRKPSVTPPETVRRWLHPRLPAHSEDLPSKLLCTGSAESSADMHPTPLGQTAGPNSNSLCWKCGKSNVPRYGHRER